jgi:predicted dehydrogenase
MLTARDYGPVAPRGWFVDRGSGGGQLLERGSHHIDLQRALMGEIEAVEVTAGRVALAQAWATHGDIEDVLVTTLHFHTGAIGSISIAWTLDDQPEVYSMDVIATEATLSLELGPQAFRIAGVAGGRRVAAVHGDPFTRSIDRFLDVIRGGEPSRIFCTPEDALRTLIAALACERALALGARVAVES